jgi:alpha-amylase/alpha-mannosidase (GH57 family)
MKLRPQDGASRKGIFVYIVPLNPAYPAKTGGGLRGTFRTKPMTDKFVAIHGHFYQPPRENPWLEVIETEESARPAHDWNERIAFECYRPNAHARIVDGHGKILEIFNNYSSMNFNFGPTLLPYLEEKFPTIYQRIIEGDREGLKRFGHGNAIAQVYNHIILPLANDRDRETEVLWGIADFEKRFHRKPDALWLPETAVNYPTLRILVKYGMKYLILSPFQALKVRPFGGKRWTDVKGGPIDPTQPYRCLIKDGSGKKISDQYIDIFFYDGVISKEVSFEDLLKDGNTFCERFLKAFQPSARRPQLIHIATDGETYGHHKKFGDMALAYALNTGFSSRGMEVINHGAFLKRFPPVYEVEIDEGPKGEGTSWSCAHGVGRWKEDCGCSTGGMPGWNQKWRGPLREALTLLGDELGLIFEKEGEKIFRDVWEARNSYIQVVLDRSQKRLDQFFDQFGVKDFHEKERVKGLKLLEMQRHALQMFTSCGWFFADLAGLEAGIVLQQAARAIELAEEFGSHKVKETFLQRLSEARSNLPEMGDGRQIYERLVKAKGITVDQVVNHYAISSLFDDGAKEARIFSFHVERQDYEKLEKEGQRVALGQVRVTPDCIPEAREYCFGLISSTRDIFRTWISGKPGTWSFDTLKEKCLARLEEGEEALSEVLTSILGDRILTIRELFKEGRQAILQGLLQNEIKEHCRSYAELFDKTKQTIRLLAKEGLEIPYEIRMAAEVTLKERFLQEVRALRLDFRGTLKRGEIERIIEEVKGYGFYLRKEEASQILNEMVKERMESLRRSIPRHFALSQDKEIEMERVEEMILLLDLAVKWDFNLWKGKEEAQNLLDEILGEYVSSLERSWWEEGLSKPLPDRFLALAEKLGFNVDRFLKMKIS